MTDIVERLPSREFVELLQDQVKILQDRCRTFEVEIERLRYHHAEFVVAANIRMIDQNAEIARLRARVMELERDNAHLRAEIEELQKLRHAHDGA